MTDTVQMQAFRGTCWVLPGSDPQSVADQVNAMMQEEVLTVSDDGLRLFLIQSALTLVDNQIIMVLTHGGRANLFVCDSIEVHQ